MIRGSTGRRNRRCKATVTAARRARTSSALRDERSAGFTRSDPREGIQRQTRWTVHHPIGRQSDAVTAFCSGRLRAGAPTGAASLRKSEAPHPLDLGSDPASGRKGYGDFRLLDSATRVASPRQSKKSRRSTSLAGDGWTTEKGNRSIASVDRKRDARLIRSGNTRGRALCVRAGTQSSRTNALACAVFPDPTNTQSQLRTLLGRRTRHPLHATRGSGAPVRW